MPRKYTSVSQAATAGARRGFRQAFRYQKKGMNIGLRFVPGVQELRRAVADMKRSMNVEYKHFDASVSGTASSTPLTQALITPAQGDSTQQRNGNSIKVTNIALRIFAHAGTAGVQTQVLRWLLVRDNQTAGSPPLSEILKVASVFSFRKITDEFKRFTVLWDQTVCLSKDTARGCLYKEYYKKVQNHVKFVTSTDTQGAYYLLIVANQASNGPVFEVESRLRFVDN